MILESLRVRSTLAVWLSPAQSDCDFRFNATCRESSRRGFDSLRAHFYNMGLKEIHYQRFLFKYKITIAEVLFGFGVGLFTSGIVSGQSWAWITGIIFLIGFAILKGFQISNEAMQSAIKEEISRILKK